MYSTYLFFRENIDKKLAAKSLDELVTIYRQTRQDEVFATVYVKVYGVSKRALEKFYSLDNHEKADISVMELKKALDTYNPEKNCKFVSYYYGLLNREVQDEVAKKLHTRDAIINSYSVESLYEKGVDFPAYEDYEFGDTLKGLNLSQTEREFCELVISESHKLTMTEIAKELGISRTTLYKVLGHLKEIFSYLRCRR